MHRRNLCECGGVVGRGIALDRIVQSGNRYDKSWFLESFIESYRRVCIVYKSIFNKCRSYLLSDVWWKISVTFFLHPYFHYPNFIPSLPIPMNSTMQHKIDHVKKHNSHVFDYISHIANKNLSNWPWHFFMNTLNATM